MLQRGDYLYFTPEEFVWAWLAGAEIVMTDPFPELPRRVLFVDVTKPVTKIVTKIDDVTKPKDVTKPRGGRPAKGAKPMTAAERKRRSRADKKSG
jgi:hypothetical protein